MHHEVQLKPKKKPKTFHSIFPSPALKHGTVTPAQPCPESSYSPGLFKNTKIHRDPLSCGKNLCRNLK